MRLDRVTVTDLKNELEACDPDADVRLAQQPAWPFQYAIDRQRRGPGRPGPHPGAYLGQGAQLLYLPEPVREQLGW